MRLFLQDRFGDLDNEHLDNEHLGNEHLGNERGNGPLANQ